MPWQSTENWSPAGGRSPRYALDRCQDVVDYYKANGARGGVIFTCQLIGKPRLRGQLSVLGLFNSGNVYKANDALSAITATKREVKGKLDMDRTPIELGSINP